jgi:hypothetical protein
LRALGNNKEYLKQLLLSAYDSILSESQAAEIVKLSRIIISKYLWNNKYFYITSLQHRGLDAADIAIDVIAEAFNRGTDNQFSQLINFANSLKTPISEIHPGKLFSAYYSFLTRITDAHISRTYAQLDPNGYKIQRNIKETIVTMPQFYVRKSGLGIFYCLRVFPTDGLACINYDIIEKEFLSSTISKNLTRQLLEVLAEILAGQENYKKEIMLTDVVKLFKFHFGLNNDYFSEIEFDWNNFSLHELTRLK